MLETTKTCTQCETIKLLSEFAKDKRAKDGCQSQCKGCHNIESKAYQKTKRGLVARMYNSQRGNSKRRGHTPPTYSKQELLEWLYSQKKFHVLFDNWKRLDFQTMYIPSVDRKDDYIGYTLNNIQLVTWQENKDKGHKDRKNGINNKQNKAVLQFTKDGAFIAEFHSQCEASRQTGVSGSHIGSVCRGTRKAAGGFRWSSAV